MKQKVKMLTSMAGVDFSYTPGQIVEVPADVARAWHDAHLAVIVEEDETEAKPEKPATNPKHKKKAGEDDGAENDNGTGRRTGKSGRGKNVSED